MYPVTNAQDHLLFRRLNLYQMQGVAKLAPLLLFFFFFFVSSLHIPLIFTRFTNKKNYKHEERSAATTVLYCSSANFPFVQFFLLHIPTPFFFNVIVPGCLP